MVVVLPDSAGSCCVFNLLKTGLSYSVMGNIVFILEELVQCFNMIYVQ